MASHCDRPALGSKSSDHNVSQEFSNADRNAKKNDGIFLHIYETYNQMNIDRTLT